MLLTVISLYVMYENYACSLHFMQDKKSHQKINSPTVVGQSLFLPHVDMLQEITSGKDLFLTNLDFPSFFFW